MGGLEDTKNTRRMVKVRFKYTNGHYEIRKFKSWEDAVRFGRLEGDHCLDWEEIGKKSSSNS